MPARTRGRAKFDFRGRPFVWRVEGDYWLRIASLDKRFAIAFPLGRAADDPPTVTGSEFIGVAADERRPIRLVVPEPAAPTMGGWVHELLLWSFDPEHVLVRTDGPVRFT